VRLLSGRFKDSSIIVLKSTARFLRPDRIEVFPVRGTLACLFPIGRAALSFLLTTC
jgi:hypothetical protein